MQTSRILVFVSFIIVLTFSSFLNVDNNQKSEKFIVVLDAGHGGKDPGNLGNGYKEKDIALKIVLEIGKRLEKIPGVEVVYTRKKDVFIELYERPKIANRANADLFISVHCDSHTTQAYGAGTFVMAVTKIPQNLSVAKKENEVIFLEDDYEGNYAGFDPKSPESLIGTSLIVEEYLDQSILAASLIQKNIIKNLKRKDRKVKQDVFWVLHATYMPSVLIETGFLTYKKEGSYLNSKKGQLEMAREIVNGILDYKNTLELKTTNNIFEENIENDSIEDPEINSSVIFKVQIAASSKALEMKPYNFKGLQGVIREKNNNLYKYYYGASSNYDTIKKLAEEAKNVGYKTSYIVPFKNGEKISLTEALKTTTN